MKGGPLTARGPFKSLLGRKQRTNGLTCHTQCCSCGVILNHPRLDPIGCEEAQNQQIGWLRDSNGPNRKQALLWTCLLSQMHTHTQCCSFKSHRSARHNWKAFGNPRDLNSYPAWLQFEWYSFQQIKPWKLKSIVINQHNKHLGWSCRENARCFQIYHLTFMSGTLNPGIR